MTVRPRVLAVHTGALGDFIVALPALGRLAAIADLTVMGHASRIALAPYAMPRVRIADVESAAFHTVFGEPAPALREAVAGMDAALVFLRDEDGALARGLQRAGVDRVWAEPGIPEAGWKGHAVDYYHACVDRMIQAAGLTEAGSARPERPVLAIPPVACGCTILLHPGSGSPSKNWPLAHFAALDAILTGEGHRVGWVMGPAEAGWPLPAGGEVIVESDLVRLGGILASAWLLIGNDSGIGHLAAACGCPTLSVFVASDPRVWAPRGLHARVLVGGEEAPSPAAAASVASAMLAETTGAGHGDDAD